MTRKYDMTSRNITKKFADLKRALEDIEARLKDERPTFTKKEKRQAARIAKLPKNRHCPCCNDVFLKSSQWQELDGTMMCVRCARAVREARKPS